MIKKRSTGEPKLIKRRTNDPNIDSKFRGRKGRTVSINSFTPEFHTKKLITKTKEIYGINRVAIFYRDCTLKNCLEKMM